MLSGMSEDNTRELYQLFKLYGAIPRLLLKRLFPPRPAHSKYIPRAISSYGQELNIKVNDMLCSDPQAFSTEQFGLNDSHTTVNSRYKHTLYKHIFFISMTLMVPHMCNKA